MSKVVCPCPYIPCNFRGDCEKCIEKSRACKELCNCMERIAIKEYGLNLERKQIETITLTKDLEEGARVCANLLKEVLDKKPSALLCLPAGNSAISTYKELIRLHKEGEIDFSQARFIALDEWLYLEDDRENCRHFLKKNFFDPIHADESRVYFFDQNPKSEAEECRRADAYIREHGGIDFMLLGIGMNGHLGLNEPFVDWDSYTIVTELDSVTKSVGQKYFSDNAPLSKGITLGIRHMFETRKVVLQVFGDYKADIVERLFDSYIDFDLPASALKLMSNATLVMDEGAASKVKGVYSF